MQEIGNFSPRPLTAAVTVYLILLPRALKHIKRFGSRSYPRLMDDLREISRHSPSLTDFRWSRSRISKLKREAGCKMKDPPLREEAQEKRLMKWIRPILTRRLFNTVTTAMVKEQWAKIYYGDKKPSKATLNRFRTRNGLTTIKNPKTGKKDVWVFKQD